MGTLRNSLILNLRTCVSCLEDIRRYRSFFLSSQIILAASILKCIINTYVLRSCLSEILDRKMHTPFSPNRILKGSYYKSWCELHVTIVNLHLRGNFKKLFYTILAIRLYLKVCNFFNHTVSISHITKLYVAEVFIISQTSSNTLNYSLKG